MTKGVLLFAFNNAEIDFIKLAKFAASKITQFLNVPVSIITDKESAARIDTDDIFDQIIIDAPQQYNLRTFRDGDIKSSKAEWKNTHRNSAFHLSPYDETLVLDVDYIVNSSNLSYCWNQPHDFLIYKSSFDLSRWRDNKEFVNVSDYSIPFYWATAFFFRKTPQVEILFTLVDYIKDNWQYYRFLYQIPSAIFRNDFAFSIAIHMIKEADIVKEFPGKMYFTIDRDILVKIKDNDFYFLMQTPTEGKYSPLKVSNLDTHIMNKYSILRVLNND